MVYSTKTLGRYDERLARILINYLNQNLKGLLKEDIQTKKDMMAYLKKNLRISAVITKKLSKQEEELVPMRRIYRHLYKLLFASTPLRKSYEAVLNEGNLKDIKKYENLILKEIVY